MIGPATFLVLAAAMVLASLFWLLRPVLPASSGPRRAHGKTMIALLVGVPLLVGVLYDRLGRIDALASTPSDPVRTMAEDRTAKLATRLAATPDDIAGLRLLARSYEELGHFREAVSIRSRLVALRPDDPDALVDQAEAVSMRQGGSYVGEPIALVHRALALDGDNNRALASLANDAVERNDPTAARAAWQRILDRVPVESDVAQSLRANLARTQETSSASTRP